METKSIIKSEEVNTIIRKILQEENNRHKNELERERRIRIQMYKDSFTTAIGICFFIALLFVFTAMSFALIGLVGTELIEFTFLFGISLGIILSLFGVLIKKQIKEDNETREERVNAKLKK